MSEPYQYLLIINLFAINVVYSLYQLYKLRHLISPWEYLENSYKNEHLK